MPDDTLQYNGTPMSPTTVEGWSPEQVAELLRAYNVVRVRLEPGDTTRYELVFVRTSPAQARLLYLRDAEVSWQYVDLDTRPADLTALSYNPWTPMVLAWYARLVMSALTPTLSARA